MQSWFPDPQLESLLFAKLPPEIWHYIFCLALTPLRVNKDADGNDSEAGDNLYPVKPGPSIYRWLLRPTLLATCRRVYAEAHSFIYGVERYHDDLHDYLGPRPPYLATYLVDDPYPERPGLLRLPSSTGYWSRQRTEWERRFVKVDYHDRLNGYHSFLANVHCLRVRITTKRFPWTRIEHDDEGVGRQAGDTPQPWKSLVSLARRHCEAKDAQAEEPPPAPGRLGWMPPSADRYPIGYHYLSAEGVPVSKASWTSLTGPRAFAWTVAWTARVYSGPETYLYGGIVEVDERDYQEEGDSHLDEDDEFPWKHLGLDPPPNDERGHRRKTKVGNQKA
ncbi:hypothetical protein PspLS_06427 [Pyricularia sp. CBS 133598]|nr:hypothetical protein PspLS_06427 [Pyricularia sp. CBS 133598]